MLRGKYLGPGSNNSNTPACIVAIAILEERLFIVRDNPDAHEVEELDSGTLKLHRVIDVPALGQCCEAGLAACSTHNCLYLAEAGYGRGLLHRVQLAGTNAADNWELPQRPTALALDPLTRHVMVSCGLVGKILQYAPDGQMMREIVLDLSLAGFFQALPLSNGRFLVSQGDGDGGGVPHRVCLVDTDGTVVDDFSGIQGRGQIRLKCPRQIALESLTGCVLVADSKRQRVVLFDRHLDRPMAVPLNVDHGLHIPCTIVLDESRGIHNSF